MKCNLAVVFCCFATAQPECTLAFLATGAAMRSKPLKISPFPTTLRVKFTSKLPDEDVLGLTTLEGS